MRIPIVKYPEYEKYEEFLEHVPLTHVGVFDLIYTAICNLKIARNESMEWLQEGMFDGIDALLGAAIQMHETGSVTGYPEFEHAGEKPVAKISYFDFWLDPENSDRAQTDEMTNYETCVAHRCIECGEFEITYHEPAFGEHVCHRCQSENERGQSSYWRHKRRSENPRKSITPSKRRAIMERDQYRCRYCEGFKGGLEIEHILPVCRGGTSDTNNLVVACRSCNSKKGGKTPSEAGLRLTSAPGSR